MPFKSQAQMRKLFAINPRLAKRFYRETKDPESLPERIHPKKVKKKRPQGARAKHRDRLTARRKRRRKKK